MHHPSMGPWARKWGDFLARLRALSGHHPHRPAFFTYKAHFAATFANLLQSPHCTHRTIRWHRWRRFAEAQLHTLGLPLHVVQLWGGWKLPAVARMYATLLPNSTFTKDGPMLGPKWNGSEPDWYQVPWPSTGIFSECVWKALAAGNPHSRCARYTARTQAPKRPRMDSVGKAGCRALGHWLGVLLDCRLSNWGWRRREVWPWGPRGKFPNGCPRYGSKTMHSRHLVTCSFT